MRHSTRKSALFCDVSLVWYLRSKWPVYVVLSQIATLCDLSVVTPKSPKIVTRFGSVYDAASLCLLVQFLDDMYDVIEEAY